MAHHVLSYRDGGLALTSYLAQNVRCSSGAYKLSSLHSQLVSGKSLKILEIGSGYDKPSPICHSEAYSPRCGIVGIALASLHDRCHVTLTDLPLAEEIVRKNLGDASLQGNVVFEALDWDQPIPKSLISQHWDIVLVADCTYNAGSASSLVKVLTNLAGDSPDTVVVLAHKKRHDSEDLFFELIGAFFRIVDHVGFNNGDRETGILVDIYTFRLGVKYF